MRVASTTASKVELMKPSRQRLNEIEGKETKFLTGISILSQHLLNLPNFQCQTHEPIPCQSLQESRFAHSQNWNLRRNIISLLSRLYLQAHINYTTKHFSKQFCTGLEWLEDSSHLSIYCIQAQLDSNQKEKRRGEN